VQRERVVAANEPAQSVFEAPVVGLVYDPLLSPVSDGVRPARAEHAPQALGLREEVPTARYQVPDRTRRLRVDAGVRLDLAVYELSGVVAFGGPAEYFLGAAGELHRRGVSEPELFFGAQSTLRKVPFEGPFGDQGRPVGDGRDLLCSLFADAPLLLVEGFQAVILPPGEVD
jgi:hypothetical protein